MPDPTPSHVALELIRSAFPDAAIDAADAFVPWGMGYLDAAPYGDALAGRSWPELDRTYLLRRSDALGFLGTSHLAAVLPVYLTSLVEEGVWSPAAGMLTIILTPPAFADDEGLGADRFDALVQALSEVQRVAIASSLAAFAAQDEGGSLGAAAAIALDRFWSRYLPTV